MSVITRYAPSPTGALHIGGARTALYNWALARHEGGSFLLRFEDTDRERSSEESEQLLLEAMEWLGIDFDPVPGFEGIPRQSERSRRYQEAVNQLLEGGHAYRCTCTPDQVNAMREAARAAGRNPGYDRRCRDKNIPANCSESFCVRIKVPDEGAVTRWNDLIAGSSGQDAAELDDFIVARTDGTAIYHLAVVIDDHDMHVSHVVRGREHMTSTSRQLLLYTALELPPPQFAHVPLLVESGGKKLSKRVESVSVQAYRDRGFLPQAVLNYISRLGWSHGDLEIFDADKLVELFTLEGCGRSPSQVHDDKLIWLNQQYIKSLPREELLRHLSRFVSDELNDDTSFQSLVDLLRERSKTLVEMAEKASSYFVDPLEYEPKAVRKFLKPGAAEPLTQLAALFEKLPDWDEAGLEGAFNAVLEKCELKMGALAQPVRVAVSGTSVSPGIFETLVALGRERTLRRLAEVQEQIPQTD
ncbi:MAG: glutamate--tRNA ligase [bacterium]|nr:glutamate--tRNA ligase [bacterium]